MPSVHQNVERVLAQNSDIIARLERIEKRLAPRHWLARFLMLPGHLVDIVLGDRP